jgi:hypothetical protein
MKMPSKRDYEMHDAVVSRGESIRGVAYAYAVTPSTVRRALDKVTEFECEKFALTLDGSEVRQIIGWLRNGNFTSNMLAERIASTIEGS